MQRRRRNRRNRDRTDPLTQTNRNRRLHPASTRPYSRPKLAFSLTFLSYLFPTSILYSISRYDEMAKNCRFGALTGVWFTLFTSGITILYTLVRIDALGKAHKKIKLFFAILIFGAIFGGYLILGLAYANLKSYKCFRLAEIIYLTVFYALLVLLVIGLSMIVLDNINAILRDEGLQRTRKEKLKVTFKLFYAVIKKIIEFEDQTATSSEIIYWSIRGNTRRIQTMLGIQPPPQPVQTVDRARTELFEGQGLSPGQIEIIEQICVRKFAMEDFAKSDGKLECSICAEMYEVGQRIFVHPGCHHAFHWDCIKTWISLKGNCPLCRKDTKQAVGLLLGEAF